MAYNQRLLYNSAASQEVDVGTGKTNLIPANRLVTHICS